MAFELNTLHIFGYGEAQVIGKDGETKINKKVSTALLTKLAPVIAEVFTKKPAENTATDQYHAINIFAGLFADWQSKDKIADSWRIKAADLNMTVVNDLVSEIIALPVEPVAQPARSAKK